jgi:four helix bundle protein
MYPFRKLAVWRRAHALALQVHEVTERNYEGRYWSLIDQMRRSSASIASSIAQGSGEASNEQFARYLSNALRSARQLDYLVLLARDLGVLPTSDGVRLDARVEQVARMLTVFRSRVTDRSPRSAPDPTSAGSGACRSVTGRVGIA